MLKFNNVLPSSCTRTMEFWDWQDSTRQRSSGRHWVFFPAAGSRSFSIDQHSMFSYMFSTDLCHCLERHVAFRMLSAIVPRNWYTFLALFSLPTCRICKQDLQCSIVVTCWAPLLAKPMWKVHAPQERYAETLKEERCSARCNWGKASEAGLDGPRCQVFPLLRKNDMPIKTCSQMFNHV